MREQPNFFAQKGRAYSASFGASLERTNAMAQISRNVRTLWFGAALFFAGALGSWHIRSLGQETGILRFGGRHTQVIVRSSEPERFEAWSNYFAICIVVLLLMGIGSLLLAWWYRKHGSS